MSMAEQTACHSSRWSAQPVRGEIGTPAGSRRLSSCPASAASTAFTAAVALGGGAASTIGYQARGVAAAVPALSYAGSAG